MENTSGSNKAGANGMSVKQCWQSQRGFTIMEVLVRMTIFTILIGIAIPAWNGLVPQVNLNSAAGQLYIDLNSASRRAAMSLYRRVRLGFNSAISYTLEREQTPGTADYPSLESTTNLDHQQDNIDEFGNAGGKISNSNPLKRALLKWVPSLKLPTD